MKTLQIHRGVFSTQEIQDLIDYYRDQPYVKEKMLDGGLQYKNKNNDYNIDTSVPYKIINPKLKNILGEHSMQFGTYLESHKPFSLHVDNNTTFQNKGMYQHLSNAHKNLSVLIPLSEHELFSTVFFDYSIELFDKNCSLPRVLDQPQSCESLLSHLSLEWQEQIQWIPVDGIFHWRLGDLAVWHRDQLHCASNFLSSGLTKQAVTIFL